ncbi:hypothetical protein M8J76_011747 [Diaphorina citri]|nr:hypothetical protein M8J76_011747 [Diaphorina citri]
MNSILSTLLLATALLIPSHGHPQPLPYPLPLPAGGHSSEATRYGDSRYDTSASYGTAGELRTSGASSKLGDSSQEGSDVAPQATVGVTYYTYPAYVTTPAPPVYYYPNTYLPTYVVY